jgi:hypothetical protein
MRNRLLSFALFLFSLPLLGEPVITSITPDSGPGTGGTVVTIKGTGFETCIICSPATPPFVSFAGVPAASTQLVDSTTLVVVTPPMLTMTVPVTVSQATGSTFVENGFTFTGESGYSPVLLPIFSPPIRGAFGSEFVTSVSIANRENAPITYLGLDTSCFLFSPVLGPLNVRYVEAGLGTSAQIPTNCNYDSAARVLWVRSSDAGHASFNIRVHDTSRNASSHGTEIPVVHPSDFSSAPIVLAGIPTDNRFRAMLRVYTLDPRPLTVLVSVNGVSNYLEMAAGQTMFEPGYASLPLNSPALGTPNTGSYTVVVTPPGPPAGPSPVFPTPPVWAFITVTNNDTQEITTITPDL